MGDYIDSEMAFLKGKMCFFNNENKEDYCGGVKSEFFAGWLEAEEQKNIECAILQGRLAYFNGTDSDKYKGDYKDEFRYGYNEAIAEEITNTTM